jgi:hypothetical protein
MGDDGTGIEVEFDVCPKLCCLLWCLMMEAIHSFETSVLTRVTLRHIPEDGILHHHRCENLKSYIISHHYEHSIGNVNYKQELLDFCLIYNSDKNLHADVFL